MLSRSVPAFFGIEITELGRHTVIKSLANGDTETGGKECCTSSRGEETCGTVSTTGPGLILNLKYIRRLSGHGNLACLVHGNES